MGQVDVEPVRRQVEGQLQAGGLNEFGGVIGKFGWKFLTIGYTLYITHFC